MPEALEPRELKSRTPLQNGYTSGRGNMQAISGASGKGSALEQTTLPTTRRPHGSDDYDNHKEFIPSNNNPEKAAGGLNSPPSPLSIRDRNAVALLIVLCTHAPIYDRHANHVGS